MKNKIKALIFDIGGVLFFAENKKKRNRENLLSSLKEVYCFLKNVDVEKFYEETLEIYMKSSANKISKKETLKLFSKKLGISTKETERIFEKLYRKNVIENKKLYNYILKLKKRGYKIGISSIQFHLSRDVLIPKRYHQNFDALQISCEDGFRKPDRRVFEFILNKLKTKPEESIFIDDKRKNLDAAKKFGMKTIIFKNNAQFFRDLKKFNVK